MASSRASYAASNSFSPIWIALQLRIVAKPQPAYRGMRHSLLEFISDIMIANHWGGVAISPNLRHEAFFQIEKARYGDTRLRYAQM